MSKSNLNIDELFEQAQDTGAIPTGPSLDALTDLGVEIENAMGISAEDVPASEVFLLTMVIDDSSSIRFEGNTQHVRDGHNLVLDELSKSNKGDDILVHTAYLNGGTLYPYCPLSSAPRLDRSNYNPSGGTPLFERSEQALATVRLKEQEFANEGVPVRTVTVIVTDGADNGWSGDPATVKALVDSMLRDENHIVAFMGIDDGYTDFHAVAKSMGIRDDWVLTPGNDGHSIREAFGVVSRISKTASQGADSFSATAQKGFDASIS